VLITQHMDEAVAGDRLMALDGGRVGYLGPSRRFFSQGISDAFPLGVPSVMALAGEVLGNSSSAADGWVGPGAPAGVRTRDGGEAPPFTEDELVTVLERARSETADGRGVEVRFGAPVDSAPPVGEALSPAGPTAGPDATLGLAPTTPPTTPSAAPVPAAPVPAAITGPGDVVAFGLPAASAVRLRVVSLTYNRGTFLQRAALDGVDVSIAPGVVTAVVGATASGKSTLLQVVAGLLRPDSGSAEFFGSKRPDPGEVGMVFQRPETQLFKSTVWEDVAVAPRLRGLSGAGLERRVEEALCTVGLDPGQFGGRSPHGLSLGEQRRVALAGVISLDPRLLVLDEPGAGLDPLAREQLMTRLVEWVAGAHAAEARRGDAGDTHGARSLAFSSHDLDEVARRADRVIVLDRGSVAAEGPAAEVLSDVSLLEAARLHPPLATRVAARLGAPSGSRVIDSAGFVSWFRAAAPVYPASVPAGGAGGADGGRA